MSIRFTCAACRTVLKIESMIKEEKKVRCTTCSIVILLTPDLTSPTGLTATLPDQSGKKEARAAAAAERQKKIILSAAGVLGVVLLIGMWWTFRTPGGRAAIEGEVTLDGAKLDKGKITFTGIDNPSITTEGEIIDGRYRIPGRRGPALGNNKVQVSSMRPNGRTVPGGPNGAEIDILEEAVAPAYSSLSSLTCDVQPGSNKQDFAVKSRDSAPSNPVPP